MPYTEKFEDALLYAARLHREQARKGTGIPYVTHLLAVAAIVGENGGTEDEVIAALLHDAPEDAGGEARLEGIRARFGEPVGDIVAGCRDGTLWYYRAVADALAGDGPVADELGRVVTEMERLADVQVERDRTGA